MCVHVGDSPSLICKCVCVCVCVTTSMHNVRVNVHGNLADIETSQHTIIEMNCRPLECITNLFNPSQVVRQKGHEVEKT